MLTAFRPHDASSDALLHDTDGQSLYAPQYAPLADQGGLLWLSPTSTKDNLRSVPTTMDWYKAEATAVVAEPYNFIKMMNEPVEMPDSLLHDLRLVGDGNTCSESVGIDHVGLQSLITPNGVTFAACNLVTLMGSYQFKVYDYSMLPNLIRTDRAEGHEVAFATMKGRVQNGSAAQPDPGKGFTENENYYLLIGTQINPEDRSAIFKVAINLPTTGDFSEVNATILELIEADVIAAMESFGQDISPMNIAAAEVVGMEKLKNIIEDIIDGSFNTTMSELLLKSLGFYEVKTGSIPEFTRSTADSTSLVKDYAGLHTGQESLLSAFNNAASAQPYGISAGVVITDNLNYGIGSDNLFNAATHAFSHLMPQKIIVWLHYFSLPSGVKKIFYKIKVGQLTREEVENGLELAYEEYRLKVYQGNLPSARPDTNENISVCPPSLDVFLNTWRMRPSVTNCIPEYVLAPPGCIGTDKNLLCNIAMDYRQYYAGAMCGFVDGFLDGLGGLMDVAEGLVEFASHSPGNLIWFYDIGKSVLNKCVKEGLSWKSVREGSSEKWERDKVYIDSLVSTANAIVAALNDEDVVKKAFNMFYKTLEDTVKSIAFFNGVVDAGYTAGGFLFEVVIDFLTAGTAVGAKWISKLSAEGKNLFVKVLGGGFDGMRNLTKTAWYSSTASLQRAKCRIGFGCFIASTMVHTAAGAIPIINFDPQTLVVPSITKQLNNPKEYILAYSQKGDETRSDLLESEKKVSSEESITPEGWKWVFLHMEGEDGAGNLSANLRRPIWWLKQQGISEIGDNIWLSLPEMGISGTATVTGFASSNVDTRISTFTSNSPYIYRPITGWFERDVPEVWDYTFSTKDTISATPNHLFFSEDRQGYVAIGELGIGEKTKTIGGKSAALISKDIRSNIREKVYNIEVWKDHNFHVGLEGILVHNNYAILEDFINLNLQDKLDFLKTAWTEREFPKCLEGRKFLQSIIGYYKFTAAKGWVETGEFFNAIDFHSVTQKMAVSIKTTRLTNVSQFLSQQRVKNNILELITGKQAGFFTNATFPVDKVQLSILVPKENYSPAMVTQWKAAISAYVQQNHPGETLWIDIDFIEKHLN